MKKIAIIGIGGRTGAMFGRELRANHLVFGVGREREIEEIKKGNLFLKRGLNAPEEFEAEMVRDSEFQNVPVPEAIFLCTKNPVAPVIKYYYQTIKEKGGERPILFLSQNGIFAGDEAREALKEVFGADVEKIRVIRISLFNSVGREDVGEKVYLNYSLPIRLSFGPISGSFEADEVKNIFDKTGIEAEEVSRANVKNMEFSKLFLNLIGMAAASHGFSVEEGYQDQKIFEEEVKMLREYIGVVEAQGNDFLNFSGYYPVKLMATLFKILPMGLLTALRSRIGKLIDKGRKGKKKDLDEIEYYNGAVVKLGEKVGLLTPINQKIIERVLIKS